MSAGFVYVLINPAVPGLTKVGKTTRSSTDRQLELSSATGVPSPFILAYEHPVADCHAVESWVHAELDRRGYRLSNNREFFAAPLHEIVSVVVMCATSQGMQGESIKQSTSPVGGSELIEDLSMLADEYRYGKDDVLRNPRRALELYEQAAKLGDAYSYEQAAGLLLTGDDGFKPDLEKALEYFKRALSLRPEYGWELNGKIAMIYSEALQAESALPYWRKFSEGLDQDTSKHTAALLYRYCFDVVNFGVEDDFIDSKVGLFGSILIDEVSVALYRKSIDVASAQRMKDFIVNCVGRFW